MNSCACISYRSKKRCLQACAYATAICVKLNSTPLDKIQMISNDDDDDNDNDDDDDDENDEDDEDEV